MPRYQPKHLKLWTLPPSYFGADWTGFYGAGFGQTRDSSALERSNFQVAWETLSAISDRVEKVNEGHWACGWVEWIAIAADDIEALKAADDMRAQYEGYPVLSDDHYSETEQEEANEVWSNCYSAQERIKYIRAHPNQFDSFHNLADLLGCVRGKYFAGYAGELIG